jgi:hypothetical protein
LTGAAMDVRWTGLGVGWTRTIVAIRAIPIRTVTPKNGPRQVMAPSSPPSSGGGGGGGIIEG